MVTGWSRLLCPVNPSSKCPWSAACSARLTWLEWLDTSTHLVLWSQYDVFAKVSNKIPIIWMLIRSPQKCQNSSKYPDRRLQHESNGVNWSSQAQAACPAWFAELKPRDDLKAKQTLYSWHLLTNVDHETHQMLTGWGEIHANPCKSHQPVQNWSQYLTGSPRITHNVYVL